MFIWQLTKFHAYNWFRIDILTITHYAQMLLLYATIILFLCLLRKETFIFGFQPQCIKLR